MITSSGSLLCAIDTETIGANPEVHGIWQIAIVPLDFNLKIDKSRPIFDLMIKPENIQDFEPGALDVSTKTIKEIEKKGLKPEEAADLFDRWFDKLALTEGKRIIPVAQNWKFDSQFISKWLGFEHYSYRFDGLARDTLTLALALNDMAEFRGAQIPFPTGFKLSLLCSKLGIKHDKAHDALGDALVTVEVYKSLLNMIEFR